MSKRMRNLSGKKRSRKTRAKENKALAMDIADAADAFVGPTPYASALRYIPQKQKMTLRYAQKFKLSTSAGLCQVHTFRANDLYDPDSSGAGHQPRGFDQMMQLYDHFQVIGSKIRILASSEVQSSVVGVTLTDSTATGTAYLDYMENNPENTVMGAVAQQQQPHHITLNYSQGKFFGTSALDDKYQGSSGSSPLDQAVYHVFATATDDLASTVVDCVVILDFIAVFTEPRNPVQS